MRILNPATGALLEEVDEHSPTEVAARVARARAARLTWRYTPYAQRQACLQTFRLALELEADELARTLTLETGKPIREARAELAATPERVDFFLRETPNVLRGHVLAPRKGTREEISREPLGAVACISAWNYPWFVGCNVILPALLCGNTVLYKPSEHATLTGRHIARLLHAAGVPEDVFVPVIGAGGAGAALLQQDLDGVFFTGSYPTGASIARALAGRLLPLQLELGGKDPAYVCADADPVLAAASLVGGSFYNAGQSCCAVERIYVAKEIFGNFVAAFVAGVQALVMGDPLAEQTSLGPLTRSSQADLLDAQIADALAKGARLVCGGKRRAGPGNFYEPGVLVDVDQSMRVMREESFGPLIGIMAVEDDAEALACMADTDYGLTASVYTPDDGRFEVIRPLIECEEARLAELAEELAFPILPCNLCGSQEGLKREATKALLAQLEVGSAYWNCCDRVSPQLPWSGRGHSGRGVTLGYEGIASFTRPKAWHLRG